MKTIIYFLNEVPSCNEVHVEEWMADDQLDAVTDSDIAEMPSRSGGEKEKKKNPQMTDINLRIQDDWRRKQTPADIS